MMGMDTRIRKLQRRLDEYSGQRKRLKEESESWREKEKENRKALRAKERALTVIRDVANETLNQLNYELSEPCTFALQGVFDDEYEIKIDFTSRRNQTECDVWVEVNGAQRDLFENTGGGVRDVVCFGLQAAILSMKAREDGTSPVLVVDEPFSQLKGAEANIRTIQMMKSISDQLGIQIITVSDERAAQEDIQAGADKLFRVEHDGEKSVVKEAMAWDV